MGTIRMIILKFHIIIRNQEKFNCIIGLPDKQNPVRNSNPQNNKYITI